MDKQHVIFAVLIIAGCYLTYKYFYPSPPQNFENTEFKCPDSEAPITALFKCVKYDHNHIFQKYTLLMKEEDKYGDKWVPQGYYHLSQDEYDEMLKYQDSYHYIQSHEKDAPTLIQAK